MHGREVAAHLEAISMPLSDELRCGAYEGHCCQRSDDDAYSVNGMALVFVDFESLPDVLNPEDDVP